MSGRLARWSCLACALVACNGVGRSVVGEHSPTFASDVCEKAVPCKPIELEEPQALPKAPAPIDLRKCRRAGATLCPGSATTPAGDCTVDGKALERTFQESYDLGQLGCAALHLVHSEADPAQVRIEIQAWNQVHMDIESNAAVTLELVGGQLEYVSLALRGPITLRILDSAFVRDLHVLAGTEAVQIELVRSSAVAVSVDAPQGQVLIRRSSLRTVKIASKRIELESSSITDAAWQAATLNAADATLTRVRSAVERSVLSSCDVSMTSFENCQSLTAVQGNMTDVQMFACAEEIGIYGGAVVHSQLEGDLILDAASLGGVVLGLGEVGAIMTWDTQLRSISFCADQPQLTFGGSSAVRCAHCDLTPVPAQVDGCQLEQAFPVMENSASCPELLQKIPACGDPQPKRMRPPRH